MNVAAEGGPVSESLIDFLTARIAEDYRSARDVTSLGLDRGVDSFGREHFAQRMLAECEAKWRIVERFAGVIDAGFDACGDGRATLGHLAMPYADHPDYREEWKP